MKPQQMTAEERDQVRRMSIDGTLTRVIRGKNGLYTIYLYTNKFGRPCAAGYKGKSLKPAFKNYFADAKGRWSRCTEWAKRLHEWERSKANRLARRNQKHTLKVGDILKTVWGYDQTNIDYYEVVSLKGKTMVNIRKVCAACKGDQWMQGESVPVPGKYTSEAKAYKVDGETNTIRIASYAIASKMEPVATVGNKPIYATSRWTAHA